MVLSPTWTQELHNANFEAIVNGNTPKRCIFFPRVQRISIVHTASNGSRYSNVIYQAITDVGEGY
jgi:hypothetical protein